jgi:hypothetical protein
MTVSHCIVRNRLLHKLVFRHVSANPVICVSCAAKAFDAGDSAPRSLASVQ